MPSSLELPLTIQNVEGSPSGCFRVALVHYLHDFARVCECLVCVVAMLTGTNDVVVVVATPAGEG